MPPEPSPSPRKLRLLWVEDHKMVFQGFRDSLRSKYDVLGPVIDGNDAIDQVALVRPDVVMLDLDLPGRHGTDILPELVQRFPDIPVIVVTVHNTPAVMEHVLRLGAKGFVPKGADVKGLRNAITSVMAGEIHRSPLVGSAPPSRTNQRHDKVIAGLDSARKRVFELIGKGHTTVEVARLAGMTRWGVYYHRKWIRKLMRITSEKGLDRAAMEWVIRQQAQRAAEAAERAKQRAKELATGKRG